MACKCARVLGFCAFLCMFMRNLQSSRLFINLIPVFTQEGLRYKRPLCQHEPVNLKRLFINDDALIFTFPYMQRVTKNRKKCPPITSCLFARRATYILLASQGPNTKFSATTMDKQKRNHNRRRDDSLGH